MQQAADKLTPTKQSTLAEVGAVASDHLLLLSGGVSRKALVSAISPALAPEDAIFTYDDDGNVETIAFQTTGRVLTFAYNSDGDVDTITDDGAGAPPAHTKTFSYNTDGSVASYAIS